ncbi:MAG: hypothetical protein C0606_17935 [Hyphomicrobiales bacterium]|nr:MAG: hypothetical protein C0606_17935 [Hyphomicrobiales bacterium]
MELSTYAGVDMHRDDADIVVLLVSSDPSLVATVSSMLNRAEYVISVIGVACEADAMAMMRQCQRTGGRRMPDLVLLSVEYPGQTKQRFFTAMQDEALLGQIPVCALATSLADQERRALYEAGANAIVERVDTLDGLSEALNTIVSFWFRLAKRAYIA